MTDAVGYPLRSRADTSAAPGATERWPLRRSRSWQPALLLAAIAAAAAGWLLAAAMAEPALLNNDAELALLLRFMAVVKAVIAVALTALTLWRLGHPLSGGRALLYCGACLLMMAAPGVIWHLTAIGFGAALFHAGVLLWLAALVADHDAARQLLRHALNSHPPETSGPHAR